MTFMTIRRRSAVATPLLLAAMMSAPAMAQSLDRADANHDGRITRAEFAAMRAASFDRMDRNGDGRVTQDDFGRIARFRPQAGQAIAQFIAGADGNGDGAVTRDELARAPMPAFDRADANHDGVIDASEADALRAAMGRMQGQGRGR